MEAGMPWLPGLSFIVLWQQDAKVIITQVRRKVVPYYAWEPLPTVMIYDSGLQYLNRWKALAAAGKTNIHRHYVQRHRVTVTTWVIPMCQRIKAAVDHL